MHSGWFATQTRAEWEATSSTVAAAGREDKTSLGGRLLLVVMGAALDDFHNLTVNLVYDSVVVIDTAAPVA